MFVYLLSNCSLLAVGASVLAHMVLGMLWYSPTLFGNLWIKEMEPKTCSDQSVNNCAREYSMGIFHIIGCVAMATALTLGIGYLLTRLNITAFSDALMLAEVLAGAFLIPVQLSEVLFQDKSWKLALIDLGYWFTGIVMISHILLSL